MNKMERYGRHTKGDVRWGFASDVVELDKDKMWHSLKKVPPYSGYGKRNVVIGPNSPHSLPDFKHGLSGNTGPMPTPTKGQRPPERHTVGKAHTWYFEQCNGEQRHWFSPFRRKSLEVTYSLDIPNETMALFAVFYVIQDQSTF
jgi:hypothetical protein